MPTKAPPKKKRKKAAPPLPAPTTVLRRAWGKSARALLAHPAPDAEDVTKLQKAIGNIESREAYEQARDLTRKR